MQTQIIVQKYGGSSLVNIRRVKKVARRIVNRRKKGHQLVVVVSALGDTTDGLLDLAYRITSHPQEREIDMLISTGEQVSSSLLAMAIHKLGYEAISFTGAQVGIITDQSFTKAKILKIDARRIKRELSEGKIVIVAGFQGVTQERDITTLGRGGSDLTAVALAKTLKARVCEIYTDVEGIYTADPRIVAKARRLSFLTYDEMLEMASLGAQVMQARSIELAKKFGVPIQVRSSFSNKEGTMIEKEKGHLEAVSVTGVTLNKNEAKLTLRDVPDRPGIAARIFKYISEGGINVDTIVQNISRTGFTDLSFTVSKSDSSKAFKITKKVAKGIRAGEVLLDDDISRVSIVGVGMRTHPGIAAKMFEALAEKKINIEMISTSEISVSCIIKKRFAKRALNAVHNKFKLGQMKT